MSRALVIDTITGAIGRTVSGDPSMFAAQLASGESLWALGVDDDGAQIDDEWMFVDESGELALVEGSPKSLPSITLEYITEVAP